MKTKFLNAMMHHAFSFFSQKCFANCVGLIDGNKPGLYQSEMSSPKGGFFSESAMRFLDLRISKKSIPKSYPELEI